MTLVRAVLILLFAVAAQAGLGRLWPEASRFVDLMIVPVIWYGAAGSQRSAMFVGCAAGLAQDSWLQIGVFGLNGFKKTLLGFALGGIGSRFELNGPAGRLASGVVVSLADSALDVGMRRLLDQSTQIPGITEIALRAMIVGVLMVWSSVVVERARGSRLLARWV